MTQEEKNLLLTDLCGRLPYGVKVNVAPVPQEEYKHKSFNAKIVCVDVNYIGVLSDNGFLLQQDITEIKPYLFPLSSMTEEQKKELFELCTFCIQEDWEGKKSEVYAIEISSRADPAYCFDHNFYMWGVDMRAIDWLNKNHFDYRGLIEKGLALDATNLKIY